MGSAGAEQLRRATSLPPVCLRTPPSLRSGLRAALARSRPSSRRTSYSPSPPPSGGEADCARSWLRSGFKLVEGLGGLNERVGEDLVPVHTRAAGAELAGPLIAEC